MPEKKIPKKVDRRSFIKYSLGIGGGLMLGSRILGLMSSVDAAVPGEKIQKLVISVYSRWDHPEFARMMVLSFKEIGVEVDIEVLELGAFLAKAVRDHGFSLSMLSWSGTMERIDPSFFLTDFYHSKKAEKGGRNYEHYRNPEYDKICESANAEMDLEKRIKLVHKCQEILARDYPIYVVGFPDWVNAYNSQEWEGPVAFMGCGIGGEFSPWTMLKIRPKTSRKKIVTAVVYDLETLSLEARSGNARAMLRMIYDTFLKLDPDLKVIPWAAKSWRIVNDTTIDIVLREGMRFHDGKPVTMEDVKFTFDYIKDRQLPMYKEVYDLIKRTEVLDNNTFRFSLVKPHAPFLGDTLVYAHILPKHIWEKINNPEKYPNENPIGSGPFKFGYWKRGEELYLEANKEHFQSPKIDGFYRKVIASMEGIIGALEKKEIDIEHDKLSTEQIESLSKLSHLSVVSAPNHGVFEMRGDLDKKPFSDLAFRRAVSYIIPRKEYMALVFGKAGRPGGNSILHPQLKPWYNEKVGFDEYSVEKAKAILKGAKYTWDKKGFLCYPA